MSGPEPFLLRWSRRKRGRAEATDSPKRGDREAPENSSDVTAPDKNARDQEAAFDLAALPSIESITAATDIRAFLAPLVPSALKHAALRRVWAADTKIRDFVGLADYDWDFNAPGSMAGFGPLESTDALRRQLADLIGRDAAEDSARCSKIAEAKPIPSGSVADRSSPPKSIDDSITSLRNSANPRNREATQRLETTNAPIDQREKPDELPLIAARRHGQALPK